MSKATLILKDLPDGFGFIYGQVHLGDETRRVDIMPPVAEWRGDVQMSDHGPHETDWVVYLDGEEIARVREREHLENAILVALPGVNARPQ